ncbi:MAG: DUF1648 domain-containing protein [Flavobacteriaceae bacterium]
MDFVNLFKKYEDRPRLKIEPTAFDKILDASSLVLVVLIWVTVFQNYADLPAKIPMHFNATGEVNEYGNKQMIWLLPGISIALFLLLYFLNKMPHNFNYLVKITPQNAKQQYTIGTRIMRFTNLFVSGLFYYIVYKTVAITQGTGASTLDKWFSPLIMFISIGGIVAIGVISVAFNKKSK